MDNSVNAVLKNASLATLTDDRTVITVAGYPVTLPENFAGEAAAVPDMPYTFSVPQDHFDYTVKVTVNGEEVTPTDNGDGSYTVPADRVTGEIVVTATRTGKIYQVTLGTDMRGEETAQYGVDYVAAINQNAAYRYVVKVTVGGKSYTGYQTSGKTYTIPGGDITGDVVFKVTKTKINSGSGQSQSSTTSRPVTQHAVTFSGSGAGAAEGNAVTVANGSKYTLTLKREAGYTYRVFYKMGDDPVVEIQSSANGTYVISGVTAALEIIIEKQLNVEISVHEYVTLDKQSVFMILVRADLADGSVIHYKDMAMRYCEAYDAWAHLVITAEELDLQKVQSLVTITEQTKQALEASGGDVDRNRVVDIHDMQLVHDVYLAKYDSFDVLNMVKFFNADINADEKVDVRDAAAAVEIILGR